MKYRVVKFDKFKLIFVSVYKACSTSIKDAILRKHGYYKKDVSFKVPNQMVLKHNHVITPNTIFNYPDYFKFTFTRNPWDRLVSCYFDKIKTKGKKDYDWKNMNKVDNHMFYRDMPFDDFVECACSIEDARCDQHLKSQYCAITIKGTLMVDFIGRYERLEDDWGKIAKLYDFGHLNVLRKTDHKTYKDYYTSKLIDIVAKRYHKDITLLGYKFNG